MVNYKDKERIIFLRNVAYYIQDYESSSEEINLLIYEFYCKCFRLNYDKNNYEPISIDRKSIETKAIGKNKFLQLVPYEDLVLCSIFKILYENAKENYDDDLSKIISKIYWKFDEIIYSPIKNSGKDVKDIKYNIEIEFEE